MIDIGLCLRHYKKDDIGRAMVESAREREVAVRYGDRGYGKRPDTLHYPKDVLEFAKAGATSFHVSEERWTNVHGLRPELKKEELEAIRKGWDLVIDIDCPDIKLSKIITWLIISALKEHGIASITVKFSGNKGFHIGVPYEAFPSSIHGKETRLWFPEGPRRIAAYLVNYISENKISVLSSQIVFDKKFAFSAEELTMMTGKSLQDLTAEYCQACGRKQDAVKEINRFVCSQCGKESQSREDYVKCGCGRLMELLEMERLCRCKGRSFIRKLDPFAIMQVDTILISSRHLYRMPYSLHEKSGLVSIVIEADSILDFEKEMAKPDSSFAIRPFLDSTKAVQGEASSLIIQALDYAIPEPDDEIKDREFLTLAETVPKELFPPCIKNILSGIDDGRKRAVFILINFLQSVGYSIEDIDAILTEWNTRNREPLREVVMKGQLKYRKGAKPVLPPNCNNPGYYKDIGVCTPDSFCQRIRNPVNYSILKAKRAQQDEKPKRQKLTEEQKEMRRKHRERNSMPKEQ